jgi:hypothetical protein
MELDGGGFWILIGTAQIVSRDRDDQDASAKLFHDRNVLIHKETNRLLCNQEQDFYVQAGFVAKDRETVTLECNTYDGECRNGSVIAIKVDDIEFQ